MSERYKLDYDNLSKLKNIFYVHDDGDGILQCEKFKIIYINKYYVYFKRGGDEMLSYVHTSDILNDFEKTFTETNDIYVMNTILGETFRAYFWSIDDNISDIYETLLEKRKNVRVENRLKKLKKELDTYESIYKEKLKEYETFRLLNS